MLAVANRLQRRAHFALTVRRGQRARTETVVVHVVLRPPTDSSPSRTGPARIGFAVSRQVGPAVMRNLVTRRLRHLARDQVSGLPDGAMVVVRALPQSAAASYGALRADLDGALRRAVARASGAVLGSLVS